MLKHIFHDFSGLNASPLSFFICLLLIIHIKQMSDSLHFNSNKRITGANQNSRLGT